MTPADRVPAGYLSAQWQYLAGAAGPLSPLWRRIVAAWRCSRVAGAHFARQQAWRELRRRHARYRRLSRAS